MLKASYEVHSFSGRDCAMKGAELIIRPQVKNICLSLALCGKQLLQITSTHSTFPSNIVIIQGYMYPAKEQQVCTIFACQSGFVQPIWQNSDQPDNIRLCRSKSVKPWRGAIRSTWQLPMHQDLMVYTPISAILPLLEVMDAPSGNAARRTMGFSMRR